jgi:hypothetical protein
MELARIFAIYPTDLKDTNNTFAMFLDQFFSISLFIICILSITDRQNSSLMSLH